MSEPSKLLRVLLVEDSPEDEVLVLRELKRAGYDIASVRVQTGEAMEQALRERVWDVVLSDYQMPEFTGRAALDVLRQSGLDVPFLMLSGTVNEQVAVETMRAGARDFIPKDKLVRLCPALERELAEARLRAEQREVARRHEQRLADSEARYRSLFESSPLPMLVCAQDTLAFLAVNPAATRHYGYSRDEFLAMTLNDLQREGDGGGSPQRRHRRKDGSLIQVEIQEHELVFGNHAARLVVANDVTEKLRAEEALQQAQEQLRQSQKMDAVGRLAGGIAHDFNNLLSVILTFSELRLRELPPNDPAREDIEEIKKAGDRAASLTRQLLAFSRQQVINLQPLDLNSVVSNMDKMFRRVLGEDIQLETRSAPSLGFARADVGQMEQVLMNLVVNARDAMPTGGRLTLETANVELDETYAREHLGTKPGPYVMLAVSDTGCGMDRSIQAQIFEPFFTTKETGKGTGLGLSTVFGIVKQLGGSVWVYSEVGKGSTFKVYLPRSDEAGQTLPLVAQSPPRGNETILLVEDEEPVRNVAERILVRAGYRVLVAKYPADAMRLCREHGGTIDLLLSDVVMPEVSGPKLAEQLLAVRPDMKVLFMSGYTDEAVVRHGVLTAAASFVQKPLTPDTLMAKVREVLAKGQRGTAGAG